MKQEITKELVNGSAALATGTGILTATLSFFDNHAAGIGAMCTLIFGIVYIVFQFLAHKKLTLADENKKQLAEHSEKLDSHVKETNKQFALLNKGIENISDKLG